MGLPPTALANGQSDRLLTLASRRSRSQTVHGLKDESPDAIRVVGPGVRRSAVNYDLP